MLRIEDIRTGDTIHLIEVGVAKELVGLANEQERMVEQVDLANGIISLSVTSSLVYGQLFFLIGDNLITSGAATYRIVRHKPASCSMQAVA